MTIIDRRTFIVMAGASLAGLALSGCTGSAPSSGTPSSSSAEAKSATATNAQSSSSATVSSGALGPAALESEESIVVFFSATGTTKSVAERIVAATGSDVCEIAAAEPYSSADLNYNDSNSRTSIEMADPSARPALGGSHIDLSIYTTVYLGYPIWWGDAPRIMSTLVEGVDLGNATVIPFVTSSSSSIGGSAKTLEGRANGGVWKSGGRIDVSASDADIQRFIESNR